MVDPETVKYLESGVSTRRRYASVCAGEIGVLCVCVHVDRGQAETGARTHTQSQRDSYTPARVCIFTCARRRCHTLTTQQAVLTIQLGCEPDYQFEGTWCSSRRLLGSSRLELPTKLALAWMLCGL